MAFLSLLVVLLGGPPAWHPDRWLEPPARLKTVHSTASRLVLRWSPLTSGRVLIESSVDRRTLTLRLSGFDDHRPPLPEPEGSVVRLTWGQGRDRNALRVERAAAQPYTGEPSEDGYVVYLDGTPRPPQVAAPLSADDGSWAPLDSGLRRTLHGALSTARQGQPGLALQALQALDTTKAAVPARRAEAEILVAAGLPLLASEPLLRILDDGQPAERQNAIDKLLEIASAHPTMWLLAGDTMSRLADGSDPRLDFAAGRLAILDRNPELAGRYLLRARERPELKHRARYLAYVAARLASNLPAAIAHLDALIDDPQVHDDLQIRARHGRARLAYDAGRYDAARRQLRGVARRSADRPDIVTELGWLDLRADRALDVLKRTLPLDIRRDGPSRALLIGTAYLRLCHMARAAAVAGGVLEFARQTRLGRQLDIEESRVARPEFALDRPRLRTRLRELRARLKRRAHLSYAARMRQQAHRLRFSADMRQASEIRDRRFGRHTALVEASGFGWRDGRWSDARGPTDRCSTDVAPARASAASVEAGR